MPAGKKPAPGALQAAVAGILRARKAKLDNTTDQEIADKVGLSRTQVQGILKGRKHVDIEQLDQICYSLGLNLTEVVRQAEEETPRRHLGKEWTTRGVSALLAK